MGWAGRARVVTKGLIDRDRLAHQSSGRMAVSHAKYTSFPKRSGVLGGPPPALRRSPGGRAISAKNIRNHSAAAAECRVRRVLYEGCVMCICMYVHV